MKRIAMIVQMTMMDIIADIAGKHNFLDGGEQNPSKSLLYLRKPFPWDFVLESEVVSILIFL